MIQITLITDKNYFKFALTTIYSILKKTQSDIYITCIVTDVPNEEILNAENFFRKKVKFLKFDDEVLKGVKTKNHVSRAAYIKILLPQIFPQTERIIFLDSDLLLNDDITELWNKFDETYILQAVWNPGYDYDNHILGLDENDKTFNSGVMLMNLEKMREMKISEALLKFIEEKNHLTRLNDQAAFNAIFAKNWGELDLKWNVQYQFYWLKSQDLKISNTQKREMLSNPSILHFTSHSKPWMFRNAHPFKSDFKKNFSEVNGNLTYEDISFKSLLQRVKEFIKISWYRNK